jgi:hypothetical protein
MLERTRFRRDPIEPIPLMSLESGRVVLDETVGASLDFDRAILPTRGKFEV